MTREKLAASLRHSGVCRFSLEACYWWQLLASSPYINRFLSADTIVPGYANPQALNRYSYVLGNPLKYTDPSGHVACRTKEECDDMGTTPNGGGSLGGGNSSGGYTGGNGGGGSPDDDEKHPFISEMEFFSAAGDLAVGGLLTSLSAYAIIETCVLAGPACLITAPIFFTTGVFGVQNAYNGFQTIRVALDPTAKPPTGREIVDFVFPFLRREK